MHINPNGVAHDAGAGAGLRNPRRGCGFVSGKPKVAPALLARPWYSVTRLFSKETAKTLRQSSSAR
jgi:hypothetical protein